MVFTQIGNVFFHIYPIFHRFSDICALTSTKIADSYNFPENDQNKNTAGWNSPDWLPLFNIDPNKVARIKQVHQNKVVFAEKPGFLSEADSIITNKISSDRYC
ncbi:hypothetical protein ACFL67_04170 [candidate division KSB1 bacterium]